MQDKKLVVVRKKKVAAEDPRSIFSLPKIRNFKRELDLIHDLAKAAEESLLEAGCFVPAASGGLEWKRFSSGWRVCSSGEDSRPFCELPVQRRLEVLPDLFDLMRAAEGAMKEVIESTVLNMESAIRQGIDG